MTKFKDLTWKARTAATIMYGNEDRFMLQSEARTKNEACRELEVAMYVIHGRRHDVDGITLTSLGVKEIEVAIQSGEIDV